MHGAKSIKVLLYAKYTTRLASSAGVFLLDLQSTGSLQFVAAHEEAISKMSKENSSVLMNHIKDLH